MSQPPIGIDLGTTFSAIARIDESGRPVVIHNAEGQLTTPSVVMFEGGDPLVGQEAKLQRAVSPHDVVEFVKRYMGDPNWSFVTAKGVEYRAEEISALILKRLAADASNVLGGEVRRVVVTVPAYFNEAQRNATKQAGAIAGLDVLAIINEPTAAAVAFGVEHDFNGTALVYDLGGGTFDITLLRATDGTFDIIATDGDRNLGGYDWDNAIINWAKAEFEAKTGVKITSEVHEAQLRDRAEAAKHRLSQSEQAPLMLSIDGSTAKLVLTRATFDEITAGLLLRTRDLVEEVLGVADMDFSQVDELLMVGGSTRMPQVKRMLMELTGKVPDQSIHPDEAVACGAAIVADMHMSEESGAERQTAATSDVFINDVISHGLGTFANDENDIVRNNVIIPANSTIPVQRSQFFGTVHEQQVEVRVEVTEGDDSDPRYVKVLGESVLRIPPYPRGAPIEVIFSCDIDGIMHIEVIDHTPDPPVLLGEFEIERVANLDAEEVERMREAMSRLDVQ